MSVHSRHVRVPLDSKEIAVKFAQWTKASMISTRGVRIGYSSSASGGGGVPRRGLVASRKLEPAEVVVKVPPTAMLTVGDALRNRSFCDIFSSSSSSGAFQEESPLLSKELLLERHSERFNVLGRQQTVLALYMTHIHLLGVGADSRAAGGGGDGTSSSDPAKLFLPYINFLPRGEGDFTKLDRLVSSGIETDEKLQFWIDSLVKRHRPAGDRSGSSGSSITDESVAEVFKYMVAMVCSRTVTVSNFSTLGNFMEGTPLIERLRLEHSGLSMPAMVPLLDMLNHVGAEAEVSSSGGRYQVENCYTGVDKLVNPSTMENLEQGFVQVNQALEAGQELLTVYGVSRRDDSSVVGNEAFNAVELEVMYGMPPRETS